MLKANPRGMDHWKWYMLFRQPSAISCTFTAQAMHCTTALWSHRMRQSRAAPAAPARVPHSRHPLVIASEIQECGREKTSKFQNPYLTSAIAKQIPSWPPASKMEGKTDKPSTRSIPARAASPAQWNPQLQLSSSTDTGRHAQSCASPREGVSGIGIYLMHVQ